MTDYIVSYSNGSSGQFLLAMLERAASTNTDYKKLVPGKYNDAHFNTVLPYNWEFRIKDIREEQGINRFKTIYKLNDYFPAFVYTHLYCPSIQLSRWPDVKLCVVLHTEEDVLDISINGFYKTELTESWHKTAHNRFPLWFDKNNVIFDELLKKPTNQWSPKEIRMAVMMRKSMVIGTGFHFIEPIDDPRIFYIQYRDLVTSCNAVVEFLQRATMCPITDNIVKDIKDYQTRQEEFMKKAKAELGL